MFDTFIESTILMFVAIDPISLVPIFAGLTSGLSQHQVKSVYIRASIVSLFLLALSIILSSISVILRIKFTL